jgi:uncharacterized membrane protein
MSCDSAGTNCCWVIRPNRSISWRGALYVYAAVFVFCMSVAVGLSLQGFWPVLPFAGLELLALGAALYATLLRSEFREVIFVGTDIVAVEKGRRRPQKRWECPRAWARVLIEPPSIAWYPSRLTIGSHGRRVEVGKFLNEMERMELADALERSIRGAR